MYVQFNWQLVAAVQSAQRSIVVGRLFGHARGQAGSVRCSKVKSVQLGKQAGSKKMGQQCRGSVGVRGSAGCSEEARAMVGAGGASGGR